MSKLLKVAAICLAATTMLTACSTSSVDKDVNKTEVNQKKQTKEIEKVESVVKRAYDALVSNDLQSVGSHFTAYEMEISKTTPEEYGDKILGTTTDGKRAHYKSYEIDTIKPYDEKRMYVKVKGVITIEGNEEESNTTQIFMAVKEGSDWKLQTDTVISEIEGLSIQNANYKWLKLEIVEANNLIDGILLKTKISNNSEAIGYPNQMYLGYGDQPFVMHLLTDKGVYSRELPQHYTLPLDGTLESSVGFTGAEGKPLALTVSNVNQEFNLLEDGSFQYDGVGYSFYLEQITNDRAAEIGKETVDRLLQVYLSKDESEAKKVLTSVFGYEDGDYQESILADMEYGTYSKIDTKYDIYNAHFDEEYGVITFNTGVEVTYTDKKGKTSTQTFDVSTPIETLDTNGQYGFFTFDMQ